MVDKIQVGCYPTTYGEERYVYPSKFDDSMYGDSMKGYHVSFSDGSFTFIPEHMYKTKISDLEDGDYFWAKYKNKLGVYVIKNEYCFIADNWEGSINTSTLEFIQFIQKPNL